VLAAQVSTYLRAGCVRLALENYNSESGPYDVVGTVVRLSTTKPTRARATKYTTWNQRLGTVVPLECHQI
jgi:hypothetical protein